MTIKVDDNIAPVWETAFYSLDAYYDCASDVVLPVPPIATDNCTDNPVSIMLSEDIVHAGVCAHQFTRSFTYVAVDDCGNVSYPFGIHLMVNDDVPPVWELAAGLLDREFESVEDVNIPIPSARDNCSENRIRISKRSDQSITGPQPNQILRKITYQSDDGCSNFSTYFDVLLSINDTLAREIGTPNKL